MSMRIIRGSLGAEFVFSFSSRFCFLALKSSLKNHQMTTLFVQNDDVFTQTPFFEPKQLSFHDFLMMTWDRENKSKRKKRTRNSAPYSTNKILIEYLFCTISILNSNSNNNLKSLVTVKHRAWWLHCVFHISASWWFFDIILTYLITLLNTIILHRKKKRAQLKSLPHKRY